MQYKINQAIIVRYLAIDNEEGLTDLILTPTNPSGVDQTPIAFTEIGDGLYTANFTPNSTGWWLVRVSSVLKPRNIYSKSYFVGTEFTTYPPQEDGKLTSIDTKLGEVQASPTTNTLLGRLKDIYDKLAAGITATVDKVKIWDGINDVKVSYNKSLRVQTYGTPLFQDNFQNNTFSSVLWNETIAGAGSKSVANTTLILSVTTANGDSILEKSTAQNSIPWIVGSFRRFYSGIQFGTQYTNNVKEWGMIGLNNLNGLFFRLDGSNLYFIIKKSGVETSIDITAYKPNINELHTYIIEFRGRQSCYAIIDDSVIYSTSSYVAITDDKHLLPFIKHYNTGIISSTPSNLILNSVAFIDEADVHKTLLGCDEDGIPRCVHTTAEGRLEVESFTPSIPLGSTEVNEGGQVTVTKQGGTNSYNWIITNGKTFILRSFEGGGYIPKDGNYQLQAKIELWYQPNGSAVGEILISVIYLQGSSEYSKSYDREIATGNGTRRMQMRIINWSVEAAEFGRFFRGYTT